MPEYIDPATILRRLPYQGPVTFWRAPNVQVAAAIAERLATYRGDGSEERLVVGQWLATLD